MERCARPSTRSGVVCSEYCKCSFASQMLNPIIFVAPPSCTAKMYKLGIEVCSTATTPGWEPIQFPPTSPVTIMKSRGGKGEGGGEGGGDGGGGEGGGDGGGGEGGGEGGTDATQRPVRTTERSNIASGWQPRRRRPPCCIFRGVQNSFALQATSHAASHHAAHAASLSPDTITRLQVRNAVISYGGRRTMVRVTCAKKNIYFTPHTTCAQTTHCRHSRMVDVGN